MKLKQILKCIIPNKMIQFFRLGFKNIYYYRKLKDLERKDNEKRVFIFGTAIHKNLGDHLITASEIEFLSDYKKGFRIIEIPTEVYEVYENLLTRTIKGKDLIIINGGGWMGNLWKKEELLVEDMVSSFGKNKIIIFPQTIYFDRKADSYDELICSSTKAFSSHPNLTITVREKRSYDFAKKTYKNNKVLLVPDIALYYYDKAKSYRKNDKSRTIKTCLRQDRENLRKDLSISHIIEKFEKLNYSINRIDTISKFRVSEIKRQFAIDKKLRGFADSSLIITDRLHGMIFSFLVNTPCIIIDNKTKKVSGVYEKWLSKSDIIFPLYLKDDKELDAFLTKIINKKIKSNKIEFDFRDLIEEVKNGEN